jgi:6-phosphogluconolactonase
MSVSVGSNQNDSISETVSDLLNIIRDYLNQQKKPYVTIGLSGGSLIQLLSNKIIENKEKFTEFSPRLKFFYIDERFVPFKSNDSTHKGYLDCNLFESLNIPNENIFPIDPMVKNVDECAIEYECRLKSIANENNGFDILVVGFGPDGHICSLFPGHPLFVHKETQSRMVVSISDSPKPPPERVTLTMGIVNNSANILICGYGAGKAAILKEILVDKNQSIPAACIKPVSGTAKWYLDKDAANLID